ncbi:AraC family transcriptional regulator [Enterovibrio nigricans]|uniref:AraC-type DNA-binding protein n=1 Tax=Enterovibrio nigricans DSM 22720 TaxID=1121868 RepID=A0A1T4W3H7_9GAMM|nr:helix-turn-helix transcriptional regulator [Enterovibrio nigricans]PKF48952.1 AraC family transcriptional regulator [Enterovibrio nigricans]SKA71810.1 AraC-type DNA-binding protein [Enterovibrio nigricans DSM 22720]
MAVISGNTPFNADALDNLVIGVATQIGKHDSGMHKHRKHQLLFASSGCMSINLDGVWCVLPPSRAVWIPAGVEHCAVMRNVVDYRSLYFDVDVSPLFPLEIKIQSVSGLLKELIERMAHWEWNKPVEEQVNTFALFCEELVLCEEEFFSLRLPTDRRVQRWLGLVMDGELIPENLADMAENIGASAKTISRIFIRETGMPYQSWRQQWRLQTSIERLSKGVSVSDIASELEFSSDSAFISYFRKMTGHTPGRYL